LRNSSFTTICGLPANRVRNVFRKFSKREFTESELRKALLLEATEHPQIKDDLVRAGIIAQSKSRNISNRMYYEITASSALVHYLDSSS